MDGKLLRVLSPGGYTIKWFERTWYGTYRDIVYISSIPFIRREPEFHGKFLKIVNAWDRVWSKKFHTVPPWNMNRLTLQYLKLLKIKQRLGLCNVKPKIVIHYAQPHSPYIAGPVDFSKIYDFYLGKVGEKLCL